MWFSCGFRLRVTIWCGWMAVAYPMRGHYLEEPDKWIQEHITDHYKCDKSSHLLKHTRESNTYEDSFNVVIGNNKSSIKRNINEVLYIGTLKSTNIRCQGEKLGLNCISCLAVRISQLNSCIDFLILKKIILFSS